jgi:hypothetical protein
MSGRMIKVKEIESAQGHISHVVVGGTFNHKIGQRSDSRRQAKAQDCHTVMAQSSMMLSQVLMPGNLVIVHAGRRKKKACMCRVTSRNL